MLTSINLKPEPARCWLSTNTHPTQDVVLNFTWWFVYRTLDTAVEMTHVHLINSTFSNTASRHRWEKLALIAFHQIAFCQKANQVSFRQSSSSLKKNPQKNDKEAQSGCRQCAALCFTRDTQPTRPLGCAGTTGLVLIFNTSCIPSPSKSWPKSFFCFLYRIFNIWFLFFCFFWKIWKSDLEGVDIKNDI